MTPYHLAGALNAALFVLALLGLGSQLATIARRRARQETTGEAPTALLSLNYFAVSYLAYFAFFVYGFCVAPFNHYLVWPRLLGCVLVLAVLLEIARDRRTPSSRLAAGGAMGLLAAGIGLMVGGSAVAPASILAPQVLSVVATALISQSLVHQIVVVRRAGQIGAVSWRLHLFTLAKDVSTLVFGLSMNLISGWPLILIGGASAGLKLVLLAQLRASAPAALPVRR